MRAGTKDRITRIVAGAGLATIMFFSWLDTALYAGRENHLNGDLICRSFAI